MNVSRRAKNGKVDEKESLNKSQIYITTAGYKGTFSYDIPVSGLSLRYHISNLKK